MSDASTPQPRRRHLRRWYALTALALLMAIVVVALPWLLSTRAGNRLIGRPLARAFAPGRVHVGAIRLSWVAPTRLTDIVLDDPAGKTVVTAPAGRLTASLWDWIVHPKGPVTLELEGAAFSVERHANGSIDLAEALSGIFAGRDPRLDLAIRADGASVDFRAPGLPRPVVAEAMDLLVQLRPAPATHAWSIDLRQAAGPKLSIRGEIDHWQARPTSSEAPDIDLDIKASHWPLSWSKDDLALSTTLDGGFAAHRRAARWQSSGSLRAVPFEATGGLLRGETLALADLAAQWNLAVGPDGVSVERLEASSNLGRVSVVLSDLADTTRPARIEGAIDLVAVSRQFPRALGLDKPTSLQSGKAQLLAVSKPSGDRSEWQVDASLADIAWTGPDGTTHAEHQPVVLSGRATYRSEGRRLDVAELALGTRFGSIRAEGRVDGLGGPVNVDLAGTFNPDWAALQKGLAERTDPGAKLVGKPSPFRLKAAATDSVVADFGVDLIQADFFGMKLGPAPVVAHYRDGRLSIDPIRSQINGGRLDLDPTVDFQAQGGPVVRLGKGSGLAGASVNEEVSRRVLSYVAPVLDQTTRASGRVSVSIDEAVFPVAGDRSRKASVTGKVVFQDVEFSPSPMTREVIAMVAPRKELGIIRLDQPILLTIADGRINQRGLAVPIGELTRIEVEGWVDFDRNLGLIATVPVTPAMFGNNPLLGEIVAGTKVRVPIGGTLGSPKLDKTAFNAELKELGKALLVRGAGVGAVELLGRLARPRDPNAPPPPSAEERKALRLEKRNERRRARGLEPLPIPGEGP